MPIGPTELQLATYLLEVREIAELTLVRFAEIRSLSDNWTDAKNLEDRQLLESEAGADWNSEAWAKTLWSRQGFQGRYFLAVEAFLAGWARLSLLLFPVEGKGSGPVAEFRAARGRAIRDALAVALDSVLANRDLRDSWMHFDERLDYTFLNDTFGERHRFVRSSKAIPFIGNTIALLEVDSLVVHYVDQSGRSKRMDLKILESALMAIREALKKPLAG